MRSATDHSDIVAQLIQQKLDDQFVECLGFTTDLDPEMRQKLVFGKLGVAFSDNRKPRLVLDIISGVNPRTSIGLHLARQSKTCNFGATYSAYWWSRASAMIQRHIHILLFGYHRSFIYVDDSFFLFKQEWACIQAHLLTVYLQVCKVRIS